MSERENSFRTLVKTSQAGVTGFCNFLGHKMKDIFPETKTSKEQRDNLNLKECRATVRGRVRL